MEYRVVTKEYRVEAEANWDECDACRTKDVDAFAVLTQDPVQGRWHQAAWVCAGCDPRVALDRADEAGWERAYCCAGDD